MAWTTTINVERGAGCGPPPNTGPEGDGTGMVSGGAWAPPTGLLVYWSGSPARANSTPETPGTRRSCGTSAGPTRLQRATRATRAMPNRLGVICLCSSDNRGKPRAMGGRHRPPTIRKLGNDQGREVPPPQGLSDQSTRQGPVALNPVPLNSASIIPGQGGGKSGPSILQHF